MSGTGELTYRRLHDAPAATPGGWPNCSTTSPPQLQRAAKATADALPAGEHRTLDGQTHDVQPAALAPVLIAFFAG